MSEYNRVLGASTSPADAAAKFPASEAKSNKTTDLDDEHYMEQMHLLAQAISVMPGMTDKHPNATTPPPIRPRWAKYLISLGVRIDPELATARLHRVGPKAAGNHGPRVIETINTLGGKVQTSFGREDMFRMWAQANPESYEKIMSGEMSREELWESLSPDMQDALRQAEEMARNQATQLAEPSGDAT